MFIFCNYFGDFVFFLFKECDELTFGPNCNGSCEEKCGGPCRNKITGDCPH
ncbi:hypothetical protein BgiMline_036777, partial [Biomphalaria glabrata]